MTETIDRDVAFALLLKACPGALKDWEEFQEEWKDEEMPAYFGMAVFSGHVVELLKRGETESFTEVFEVIERLIVEGDEEVRSLAIVGFIESLQNQASWTEKGDQVFLPWLKPKTRAAWFELEELWRGENSLMDVIRKVRRQQHSKKRGLFAFLMDKLRGRSLI